MASERQEYPAILPQVQPPQAVNILNDRVVQIARLNGAVADWLQERRRLEEQYSLGLRRLASRPLDATDLGVFSVPWSTLMSSADTLADSHSAFAAKIETDVERPLREFTATSREMSSVTTVQGNLQALARDVERAQQKTDKLRVKMERTEPGRVATANSDLDSAQAQWQSQAPYVFENLQALDEARIGNLRDALTQLQTHEIDQIERNRVSGEQCLNVLLNVEAADEIKAFASKAAQGKTTAARTQRSSVAYGTPSRSIAQPGGAYGLAPASSRSDEDLTRERTGSTDDTKQKGRFKGGLKRFGTVMGRKRESKIPSDVSSPAESPASRSRPSPFGGRFGKSRDNVPRLDTMQETSPPNRPSSPPRLGSEIFQSPSEARADPVTPRVLGPDVESSPQVNGTSLAPALVPSTFTDRSEPEAPRALDTSAMVLPERKESLRALEGRTDSEGFSVPQQSLDPISQAEQEAALADDSATPQFNVNIRDAPLQEDSQTSEADLANVANKLQAPPPSTKRTSTIRGRRQDRNSFASSTFVQPDQSFTEAEQPPPLPSAIPKVPTPPPTATSDSTIQSPTGIADTGLTQSPASSFAPGQLAASTFSPFSSQAEQASPLPTDSRAVPNIDQARVDTQSIRSATTAGSQGAGTKHPELAEPGLNTSIIETLSARFEGGKLTSSSLIGEIALTYNPADFSSPFGTENIRIENFSSLEKVAPNPAFLKQLPERDGEYSLNLSSVSKTQVAFKYQVRLDDAGSLAPLLVTPAFRIESNQCSVIINYSLNPAFDLHSREEISLSNVMLALTVEGTKTTKCQSRPTGTFSKEKNLIYWQLNDIRLSPNSPPEKLLARFVTESEASGGIVEARWEVVGESAQNSGSGLSLSMQSSSGGSSGGDASDPFADETAQTAGWQAVHGVKKLTSGNYVAK